VTGDMRRLVASVSSLACAILTLCTGTDSIYTRTHSSRRFVIQCNVYSQKM
jgi:hypothetical protein